MAWNPAPALGGALWGGNQSLATTRQLLSTSAGLASNGDNGFDFANISTLYVCTISGLNYGTQPINIQNTSSINISTFRNININGSNISLRAQNIAQILNNGAMLLNNTDPVSGRSAANVTDILTGVGSFQALAGDMTVAGSGTLNLYGGNKAVFGTLYSQNNLPDGIFDLGSNNLIGVRSLSTINVSTGVIRASDIRANSLSSIYVSTGAMKAGATILDTLTAGATTVGTLNAAATSLSGALNMNANNITNVNTIGATTGNFTNITGTLTGNVNGNVTGNVTGNLTGNVTGNIYNTNLSIGGQYSISETVDVGSAVSNYGNYGTLALTARGGLGGIVNITADSATPINPFVTVSQLNMEAKGNYGLITPGVPIGYVPRGGYVGIIARQGLTPDPPAEVTSALFANGEIDLTAYSYGTVPGLIKLSAGANFLYAGPVSPITGIIGTNNIYGTIANTITAGTPPSVVPTFPGTNYLYGSLGTSIQNSLYVDNILNYGNVTTGTYSNLTISATNSKDVLISNVKTLNMQNTPTIDGAGTGTIQSFSNINGSNLNIYQRGYISSLTVDDIVWNRGVENFDNLYTSTLFTSTITGLNNATQAINMLNYSSINISTGRNLFLGGSNLTMTASNIMTLDNRGAPQGLTSILASTLSLYSQNNALLSANANDLTLYGGLSTITRAGTSLYLDTPIVNNKTHLDTPSLSTLNFQATNFLATTVTVANETVSGNITAQSIQATSGYFSTLFALNTTTQQASISSIVPYNAFTVPTTIVYNSTGGDQYWTAPAGITFIDVILIGAGAQSNTVNSGGLVSGRLAVSPGTTYQIIAGNFAGGYGGGGTNGLTYAGGRSAIALSGNDLVTAGGAGGNGATGSAYYGGAGGGLTGGTGQGSSYAGQGGTQSAGGAGGTRTGSGANGVAGTQYVGANALDAGGAGGGGWYGGGSGADNGIGGGGGRSGGGGGGSSYVANLSGVVVNTQGGGAGNNTSGSVQITYYANESVLDIAAPTNIVGNTNITGNTNIYGSTLVGGVFTLGGVRAIRNFVFSVAQSWAHNALNGSATVKDGAGNTYSASQWVMNTGLMAIAEIFGQNFSSALNYIQTDQHVDASGNYYISWSIVANVDRSGNNEQMQWNITMIPKEMTQTITAGSYAAGFPSTVNSSTILYEYPNTALSSIHASTLTFQASENISLLAGNFTIPTYFSSGSITVAGTNQVSLLANIVAIGAETDVDIQANTNNVNIVAGSNINLVADNYLYISSGSYMNTDVYGDMTTDLGGVYTVTSAEVINLNGSNGIGLNSSNAINLTATSNVNINTFTTIQLPGTGSIPSVSPLAITNGNDYAGTSRSQIEFQFYGGGFNHFISSRHNANVTYDSGNAIDFWLYSVNTGGDAQTASSAPGTGNINVMSLTASNVVINRPIQISDSLTGGSGTLSVDSGNHLYWNGTLLA